MPRDDEARRGDILTIKRGGGWGEGNGDLGYRRQGIRLWDEGTICEGTGGRQVFDEISEGQGQGDLENQDKGDLDILRYLGDKIGSYGIIIKAKDQVIGNMEGLSRVIPGRI